MSLLKNHLDWEHRDALQELLGDLRSARELIVDLYTLIRDQALTVKELRLIRRAISIYNRIVLRAQAFIDETYSEMIQLYITRSQTWRDQYGETFMAWATPWDASLPRIKLPLSLDVHSYRFNFSAIETLESLPEGIKWENDEPTTSLSQVT